MMGKRRAGPCSYEALHEPLRSRRHTGSWFTLALIMLSGMFSPYKAQAVDNGRPWQGSAGVSATYSDNRDGVSTNREGTLSMQGQCSAGYLYRSGDRTQVKLSATPSVKWRDDAERDAEGIDADPIRYFGRADLDMSHAFSPRITVTAGDGVAYSDDGDILAQGAMVRHAASYFNNSAKLGAMIMLNQAALATLSANAGLTRYEDKALAPLLDSDTYTGDGGLALNMGSGYTVAGRVSGTRFKGGGSGNRVGSTTLSYGAGIDKAFASELKVKTLCNYQVMQFDDDDMSPSSEWGGSVEVSASSALRTRWSMKADYGLALPAVGGYSGSRRMAARGSLDHDVLADRCVIGIHAEVSDSEYQGERETAPAGSDQKVTAGLSCDYKIDRTWTVRCGYAREDWRSELRDSFVRNIVDVGISAAF